MGSETTKSRIVDAAIETIKAEGITGTSARAIARRGGFNQALIFYHFGSIEEVLFEAIQETSRRRIERYRERLAGITRLPELAAVAADLHGEDLKDGNLTVLTQLMAGAAGHETLGPRLRDAFDPWIEVVVDTLESVVAGSPFEHLVSLEDMGFAVSALFLGIELLTHLDPTRPGGEDSLFDSISSLSALLQTLIDTGSAPVETAGGERRRIELE
jgi:AcrR family transcriptional regulator